MALAAKQTIKQIAKQKAGQLAEPQVDRRSDNAFSKFCRSCQECCKNKKMSMFYKQLAPESLHKKIEKTKKCIYLEKSGCRIFIARQKDINFLGCSVYPFYPKWYNKGKMEIEITESCPAKNSNINLRKTFSYLNAWNILAKATPENAPTWMLEMKTERIKDPKDPKKK